MSMHYFTPNDDGIIGQSDSESIQNAVNKAEGKKDARVVIPRYNKRTDSMRWNITKAILLPSNVTVLMNNCHLRLADGVKDNMFRNRNMYDENRNFINQGSQHHIVLRGIGNVLLDGGEPNGLMESTSNQNGNPPVDANNMILLHNVHHFVIENLHICDQRWWAINILFSSHGLIQNLNFYAKNNVPNQDGLNIRSGCHDITVKNITGQSGDDLVAVTTQGYSCQYMTEDGVLDTHHIYIQNVLGTSVRQCVVALRNHDGAKLHHVSVCNVFDTGNNDYNNRPYGVLRVGENLYYRTRASLMGETYRISARNVFSKNQETVCLGATLKDCSFTNICVCGTAKYAFSTDSLPHQDGGVKIEDVSIRDVYYNGEVFNSCIFNFANMRKQDYIRNLDIQGVYAKRVGCVAVIDRQEQVSMEDIFVERETDTFFLRDDTVKGGEK